MLGFLHNIVTWMLFEGYNGINRSLNAYIEWSLKMLPNEFPIEALIMPRIHKIEGYPCKHKVVVKDNAFKEKVEVSANPSAYIHNDYLLLATLYSSRQE